MSMKPAMNGLVHTGEAGQLQQIHSPEAASELDNFVYIVSHDLRNSARALTEVPRWLKDDLLDQNVKLSADVEENFELLDRHAKRLDRMLLDLLVYSRVGRMQEVTHVDIADVVERVIAESCVPDHVTVQVQKPMPSMTIGYKDLFVLVKCVLDNVAAHSARKKVNLYIRGSQKQDTVTLTFTDDGVGIRQTDLQRAFRPMTTLRRRDEVEGSGMGLAIVQRIAQHYRGSLWAGENPDGRGLRLRVRLRSAVTD